ncbi:hypothetical protein AX16_010978 [Volvariella volvacea WC 439]|nr:hypothetical protein AX16_010978 [Volvariella volvacea WC 439]
MQARNNSSADSSQQMRPANLERANSIGIFQLSQEDDLDEQGDLDVSDEQGDSDVSNEEDKSPSSNANRRSSGRSSSSKDEEEFDRWGTMNFYNEGATIQYNQHKSTGHVYADGTGTQKGKKGASQEGKKGASQNSQRASRKNTTNCSSGSTSRRATNTTDRVARKGTRDPAAPSRMIDDGQPFHGSPRGSVDMSSFSKELVPKNDGYGNQLEALKKENQKEKEKKQENFSTST